MSKRKQTTIDRAIRCAAKSRNNAPIEVIPSSDQAPKVIGQSWHYETAGGARIWHPSAYSKRGWSNMRYCHSTVRVTVGELYIAAMGQAIEITATAQRMAA
jgi:hypothetical protein